MLYKVIWECEEDSHGVSVADVFAGCLDDGLTGLVQSSVDSVVRSGIGFLDQGLELRTEKGTKRHSGKCRKGFTGPPKKSQDLRRNIYSNILEFIK